MGYSIYEFKNETMELSEHLKKGLHHLGQAMSIVEDMCNVGDMGMRSGYRMGEGYSRFGMRDDDMPEYDQWGNPMGMRGRSRDSRGRFM